MDTKLTLSMDDDVIRKAKSYARSTGRSLSDLVECYLKMITGNQPTENGELSPKVRSLLGSFSVPDGVKNEQKGPES